MRPLSPAVARLRVTLECLSYLAVIAGIVLFFVQQRDADQARRIETAMLFVSMENEPTYAEARATLTAPWQNVDMSEIMDAGPSDERVDRLKLEVTRAVPDAAIEKVAGFYTTVIGCRSSGLCDSQIIDQFFRQTINGFYCIYDVRIRIIGRRRNRPEFGSELRTYAGDCR